MLQSVNWLVAILLHTTSIILISASMMWLILNSLNDKLARSFLCCQGLLIVWLIGQLLEYISQDLSQQTIALKIDFIGICFIGPSLFLFSLKFTQSKLRLSLPIKGLIWTPSVANNE